jgi:hypothetical protein
MSMAPSSPKTAVCILRIERESWGLVITVTVNRDISRAYHKEPVRYTRPSETAAAVAEFIYSFDYNSLAWGLLPCSRSASRLVTHR